MQNMSPRQCNSCRGLFYVQYVTKYATSAKILPILKDFNVGSNPTVSANCETRVNTGKTEKASIYAGLSYFIFASGYAEKHKKMQKKKKCMSRNMSRNYETPYFWAKCALSFICSLFSRSASVDLYTRFIVRSVLQPPIRMV